MLVTSCTTAAGAGVAAVQVALALLVLPPPPTFTATSTTTTTMTSPTALQAIRVGESRLLLGVGAAGLPPGRGVFPPLAPPAPPAFLATSLPVTGRLWARLLSLALWPPGPPAAFPGLGLFPPVTGLSCCCAIVLQHPRFVDSSQ